MAERDRAAVHVHLLVIEPELADDREALRRERLIQLDEIELRHVDPGARKQFAHGGNRADAHHTRIDACDCIADERAERLDAELARLLLRRDHERRRAVVDPGRVAGRDSAALAKRGLQAPELLERRVRARMLVAADVAHGDELVVEATGVGGLAPAPL